jgi:hypothetical protein
MKRADAQKAVEAAFISVLSKEYENVLIFNLALDRPDRPAADAKFRKMLAHNVEAFGMAMKAISENSDLED